jgi:hypothetical protein
MAEAAATTKKVGTKKSGQKAGDGEKKEKKVKAAFDYSALTDQLNEDGLLTAVPSTRTVETNDKGKEVEKFDGWSPKDHKPLKRGDFATDDVFLDFRVFVLDHQLWQKQESRDSLAKRADRLRQFGDEKTRKKAAKLSRMREQMAALEAELSEEGIDVDEID